MQGLKLSELKEGHIYRCLLSGKNVLTQLTDITTKNSKVKESLYSVLMYNDAYGSFQLEAINDYQLTEIKEGEYEQLRIEQTGAIWQTTEPTAKLEVK